jgi:RNA polymerase sigma factor (TIGR02999 family)
MALAERTDVTSLLREWRGGSAEAGERLGRVVHAELRRIARAYLLRESRPPTLEPTEIVQEAWLSLLDGAQPEWEDRHHFYGIAAHLMRQTLVREGRRRMRLKRGSGAPRIPLSEVVLAVPPVDVDLLELESALQELEELDATAVRLVELRFFVGLSIEEAGEVLGLGSATVVRKWRAARAWLRERLDHA